MLSRIKHSNYKWLCVLQELDFENVENKELTYFFITSDEQDRGLAEYKIKEHINEINKSLDNKYILSLQGMYAGKREINAINCNDLSVRLIKQKIRSCS
ncbi:hypothetical protein [Bacillus xiapuensis]|uniref:Uncharacterized protein n=1 Tax=Bacillus xiapuensis TaxID=2014075 RepID=A0ABU6N5K3_9BACI|nr:hypothetical protein [Bacillus xiapuensis]